jgi:hypothetical protein
MGTTTINMSLLKPTPANDPGTWDDQLNPSLELIDTHDHTTGKGVKVPSAGININASLPFNDNAAISLKALSFTAQASYSVARSLFVKSSDNELYWRTNAGTDVKLTSGTTLNLSLVGGIGGDYAAAGASLYYDDANQAYRFLEATPLPNSWSRVLCGDLDLYEHASGITNRVRLQSPAALAASYAVTMPAALPGSTTPLQMSSTGVLTLSNTFSGAITMSSTLAVTGLVTATAGVTAAANQHVTVSGTGRHKHGDMSFIVDMLGGVTVSGTPSFTPNTGMSGIAGRLIPIALPAGKRIRTITYTYNRGGAGTVGYQLVRRTGDGSVGNFVVMDTTTISSGTGFTTTTTPAIDHVILPGWAYEISMTHSDVLNVSQFADVTFDHP